ncbi:MAG: PAS domain S-box protein [Planctomycetota bacterium]
MSDAPREALLGQLQELQGRLVDETAMAHQLRAILDAVPVNIIVTDLDGKIREVNAYACGALGYTREELISLSPWDIDAEWSPERVQEALVVLQERGRFRTTGLQLRKDGTTFPVEVHLSVIEIAPGESAVVGASMDLTERREMDRLRAERAQAREHQEAFASASGLVHYDYDFALGRGRFGGPVVELTGRTDFAESGDLERWTAMILEQDRRAFEGVVARALRPDGGEYYATEYRIQRASGQIRYVEDRGRVLRGSDGAPTQVLGFLIDRTEQRELEHRLQQAERLEAVGRLAGGVCHDFNNLLTAILGFTELSLASLPPQHPARANADQVLTAAKQARAITGQLLAFTCLQQESPPQVVDLGSMASELEQLLGHLAGDQTQLEVSCTRPSPRVLIDPSNLQRVLLNLVMNARDAMPAGGKIRLTIGRSELATRQPLGPNPLEPGDYAMLTVEDEGQGIAPDVLPHVFEPYFTTKPHGKGSGLGLATVYGIVRQAGGAIGLESQPGRGTRVVIYLPEAVQAGEAPQHRPQRLALVIEDEPRVRELVAARLVQEGWQVLTAEDGPAALALAEHAEPLDLVISDVQLPGPSGPEVVARLRESRPDLVVLFMSGYAAQGLRGIDPAAFLAKPFGLDELSRKLQEVLATAQR